MAGIRTGETPIEGMSLSSVKLEAERFVVNHALAPEIPYKITI